MSPGEYIRRRREDAGRSLREVALLLAADFNAAGAMEIALGRVERDEYHPTGILMRQLTRAFPFDVYVYDRLVSYRIGTIEGQHPQLCRSCACSFNDACDDPLSGPCHWVEPDLCSRCAARDDAPPSASPSPARPPLQIAYPVADPELARRLADGQMFNAYHRAGGGFLVGIGPVTDFYPGWETYSAVTANELVDTLRRQFHQPPCICPLEVEITAPCC